jgi:putative phosphoribosyl transferase
MPTRSPRTARFVDRQDAGRQLAAALARRRSANPVVLALPRGGVPVGAEVAARLGAPLDVLIVRKLGCPGRPELGVGAIAEDGVEIHNDDLISRLGITAAELAAVAAAEHAEADRRARRYRAQRPPVPVRGRTAIIVDDGLATGYTARAAIAVVRSRQPGMIVVAVPVAPQATVEALEAVADAVVCLRTPARFIAIGQWYTDFRQVGDDEVAALLAREPEGGRGPARAHPSSGPVQGEVRIRADATRLPGTLTVPQDPVGLVVFAHGSGSSRHSPRNVAVARALNARGLATLLFDLLDEREATDRGNVFDIELLADRLVAATAWAEAQRQTRDLRIGYFGASTGAAAALVAAAGRPTVAAVVSRGGRPDLAGELLRHVSAPTLLIVGGRDTPVVELNRRALDQLSGGRRLEIVPGATHLFAEPGALERVAGLAGDWFTTHLPRPDGGAAQPGADPTDHAEEEATRRRA